MPTMYKSGSEPIVVHLSQVSNAQVSNAHVSTTSNDVYKPTDFNYSKERILLLQYSMDNIDAITNWKRVSYFGKAYLDTYSLTCLEQQMCRCIQYSRLSRLLFPLIWDYMKPWNILRHYKSVFKKISIIRTNAHHQSVKYKFEVNNTFMKGYILCIIIPTKK